MRRAARDGEVDFARADCESARAPGRGAATGGKTMPDRERQNHGIPTMDDVITAHGLALGCFMLETLLTLARPQADPTGWARTFIGRLHERIDGNADRTNDGLGMPQEIAKVLFDQIGADAKRILRSS